MSTSLCGEIFITPPKCLRKERVRDLYYCCSIVAAAAPCAGDAVFRCESETTLFGLPKEETTRNQWLSCVSNTVPEQYKPNIRVCAAHFTQDYWTWESNLQCQLCTKAVYIKWGNFNFARTGVSDSESVHMFQLLMIQRRVLSIVE